MNAKFPVMRRELFFVYQRKLSSQTLPDSETVCFYVTICNAKKFMSILRLEDGYMESGIDLFFKRDSLIILSQFA